MPEQYNVHKEVSQHSSNALVLVSYLPLPLWYSLNLKRKGPTQDWVLSDTFCCHWDSTNVVDNFFLNIEHTYMNKIFLWYVFPCIFQQNLFSVFWVLVYVSDKIVIYFLKTVTRRGSKKNVQLNINQWKNKKKYFLPTLDNVALLGSTRVEKDIHFYFPQ